MATLCHTPMCNRMAAAIADKLLPLLQPLLLQLLQPNQQQLQLLL
jgi:hypothetical protein